MNERYDWRNLTGRFSTEPHGGHTIESSSAHTWHCVACGMSREGWQRTDFYTQPCTVSTRPTTVNSQGCSPASPHGNRARIVHMTTAGDS